MMAQRQAIDRERSAGRDARPVAAQRAVHPDLRLAMRVPARLQPHQAARRHVGADGQPAGGRRRVELQARDIADEIHEQPDLATAQQHLSRQLLGFTAFGKEDVERDVDTHDVLEGPVEDIVEHLARPYGKAALLGRRCRLHRKSARQHRQLPGCGVEVRRIAILELMQEG
jgi:hypothetical protein